MVTDVARNCKGEVSLRLLYGEDPAGHCSQSKPGFRLRAVRVAAYSSAGTSCLADPGWLVCVRPALSGWWVGV